MLFNVKRNDYFTQLQHLNYTTLDRCLLSIDVEQFTVTGIIDARLTSILSKNSSPYPRQTRQIPRGQSLQLSGEEHRDY